VLRAQITRARGCRLSLPGLVERVYATDCRRARLQGLEAVVPRVERLVESLQEAGSELPGPQALEDRLAGLQAMARARFEEATQHVPDPYARHRDEHRQALNAELVNHADRVRAVYQVNDPEPV
jgi:hypothetical protein